MRALGRPVWAPVNKDANMHDHDLGLAHDLAVLDASIARRRRALVWLAGAAGAGLFGCGGGGDATSTSTGSTTGTTGTTTTGSTSGSCSLIPEETAGPYPGDGSNANASGTVNALALSGIVRSDIRSSIAGATGVAAGVPTTVKIELVNTNGSCADLAGYAIYLWHCTQDGKYSLYSSGVTGENFLRGVQETGSDGVASFTTVFPGCYSGRMPHMHFEVYRSLSTALSYTNKLRTSQIAFPTEVCSAVYANASGYSASVANFAAISFATDNIFSDGYSTQLATMTGDVASGYTATLQVGISV
jgi:protocatechuate 3,4-dioxygenase beta subunit